MKQKINNNLDENKKKKIKIMIGVLAVVLLVVIIGVAYAIFSYVGLGTVVNQITTGVMTMAYTEGENKINITDAVPMEDSVGKVLKNSDQVFDFTVEANKKGSAIVSYEITAQKDDASTLPDDAVRLYLEKSEDGEAYTSVLDPTAYLPLENDDSLGAKKGEMVLHSGTIEKTMKEYYRLRMWVAEDYELDGEQKTYAVTVNVYGKNGKGSGKSEIVTGSASAKIRSLQKTNTDRLAYDGTSDNNLRYIGQDPNNYVTFNGELWRIVGVMNNVEDKEGNKTSRVKLIRNDGLNVYSWDTSAGTNGNYGINEWSQADIMNELNGDYINTELTTNPNWYDGTGNSRNRAFNHTQILKTDAQELIDDAVWYLGSNDSKATYADELMPKTLYTREHGNLTGKQCTSGGYCTDQIPRTLKWTGKVGLIYPSDYAYATGGGATKGRDACLVSSTSTWASTDCSTKDWINNSTDQWTITPSSESSAATYTFFIASNGQLNRTNVYNLYYIRPTVYLKSIVKITGGTGIKDDPYKLSL